MNALAALADPTRASIVTAVAQREQTANEIVGMFNLTQPAISNHLRVLREAGLVSVRSEGTRRFYRLDPAPLQELDSWLEQFRRFWAHRLDRLEAHLDDTKEVHP